MNVRYLFDSECTLFATNVLHISIAACLPYAFAFSQKRFVRLACDPLRLERRRRQALHICVDQMSAIVDGYSNSSLLSKLVHLELFSSEYKTSERSIRSGCTLPRSVGGQSELIGTVGRHAIYESLSVSQSCNM